MMKNKLSQFSFRLTLKIINLKSVQLQIKDLTTIPIGNLFLKKMTTRKQVNNPFDKPAHNPFESNNNEYGSEVIDFGEMDND